MRLNFSFAEPEKIRTGIEVLAELVAEWMELDRRTRSTGENAA